jgi:hypothetical protein
VSAKNIGHDIFRNGALLDRSKNEVVQIEHEEIGFASLLVMALQPNHEYWK